MTITINIDDWNNWLKVKGLSDNTIFQYNYYLQRLNLNALTQKYLMAYVIRYNNTVAKAFIKNLIHYIKINDFPQEVKVLIATLELPEISGRKKSRIPAILIQDEVYRLSNAMNSERDKLMCLLTFFGGLRVSELIKIKPYDFNWEIWLSNTDELGRLKIIGKGNKQRSVFLPQKLMARIYSWIKNEVSKEQSKNNLLFKMGVKRWENIVAKAGDKSLGRHINPHLLRHSCGTWLRDNNWDLKEIADYLGHESIATTAIYTHISQEKLKDKYMDLLK